MFARFIHTIHHRFIFERRTQQLTKHIAALLTPDCSVLDVGCGDGTISSNLIHVLNAQVTGVDVLKRETTKIPVTVFDGKTLPFPDASFDYTLFIDVLHHTDNAEQLLSEALRVSRKGVVIKDHLQENAFDRCVLKFMDDIGNKRFSVVLPYTYKSLAEWTGIFQRLDGEAKNWKTKLFLYCFPFNLFFDRKLHFVARLEKK